MRSTHLVCLAVLLMAASFRAAAADAAPPESSNRIVVKFRASLAQEVENALPDSLELNAPEKSVRPAWFQKHGIKNLKPLYQDQVRQKKNRGATQQQLVNDVRQRFPDRAKRAPSRPAPDLTRTYVVEIAAESDLAVQLAVDRLKADPEVEFAERELVMRVQFSPNDPYFSSTGTWGQSYADMWALYKIQAPSAWDTNNGSGILVAVIDTGVDVTHPDLVANVWTNTAEIPNNGIDDDQNGFIDDVRGWDFVGPSRFNPAPDNDPADIHGHGTLMAGTIAATGNNGLGVVGVAWGARIMAVRGMDNTGVGFDTHLASCLVYAADNGADVINNSFGGPGYSQILMDAMNYAESLGAVLAVAACNENSRVDNFFPAAVPYAITVSATTPTDGKASYSNFGGKIDVGAPGDDILSLRAIGTTLGIPVGSIYSRANGTSMATPHVAGLAALILSQQPGLTPEQVRQVIRVSADDVYVSGFDIYFGWGRINAAAALAITNPLEAKIYSPLEGQLVNATVSIAGVAQGPDFTSYTLDCGAGESPAAWTLIQQSAVSVNGGALGSADLNLPDGRNTIRLRVFDSIGRVFTDRMTVILQYSQITNPKTPPVPNAAQAFKLGAVIPLQGNVNGPSFVQYRVEWARGRNPSSGWSTSGITLMNGGSSTVTNDVFATFDTSGLTQADYYTVRLLVDNAGFTSEIRTMVYVEPDLVSFNWPRFLSSAPPDWLGDRGGFVPAWDAAGNIRLFLSVAPDALNPTKGKLLALAPDGSTNQQFLLQTANGGFQPAAANLDGSPGDEILVGDGGSVRIVRPDFSSYTFTPAETVNFKKSRVVVDDLNNSGSVDVLALGNGTNGTAYLYAWKTNGQLLTTHFPIVLADANEFQRDMCTVRFLTVDLNGDGLKEILAAESPTVGTCVLRAFNWDGTPYGWPPLSFSNHIREMVAGDLDHDGVMDVAVEHFNNWSHEYWTLLSADGSTKPGWPQTTFPNLTAGSRMALADLNRDGQLQLILSGASHQIYIWNANGTTFSPAWPASVSNPLNVSIADVDGDGFPEILSFRMDWSPQAPYDDFKLAAYRRDGTTLRFWRISGRDGFASARYYAPAVGDFQQNGILDIAAWYRLDTGGFGQAMVVSPGTAFNPATADWPLNYHDARNTSVVPIVSTGAPSVQITAPADGATLVGIVAAAAVASDDIAVVGVQFKLDNGNLGSEITTPPYAFNWDTRLAANGVHTLTAIARDADGHTIASAISVILNNDLAAPTVSITAPTNNARVGGTITVSAAASDNVGVAGVQFRLDGVNLGAEDTAAPYSVSWNTATMTNATHVLTAVARDAAGNNQTSAPVNVTVTNVIKINFQPAAAPTYPGYAVDSGAVYGLRTNGYNYGWNLNNSANAFDRNSNQSQDQRYDTLITMQTGGTFTWEIGVPNGHYSVHVVAGDASFINSVYKINVEGVLTVNGTPKNNSRWKEGTSTVTVSDGRLTVSNASGASNNKICFLEITPVP